MGYKIYIGETIQTQISIKDVIQLDYKNVPTGLFVKHFFSETDKKCSYQKFDTCMYDKLSSLMKEGTQEQCTVPWMLDNERICSNANDTDIAFWIAWNRITNQQKDCLSHCHATLVNVGGKNQKRDDDKDYSLMYCYFSSHVIKSQEHYFYNLIKLLAQLGGYASLFRLTLYLLDKCGFSRLRQGF